MADTGMATRLIFSVFSMLVLLTSLVTSQPDTSVCTPGQFQPKNTDPTKPVLPNYYRVDIEANILNRKFTADYSEYFDYSANKAAVHITNGGVRTAEVYDFNTNELFSTDRDTSICTREILSTSADQMLFGYTTANNKSKIFTANGALHFGRNISEQWINVTTVRGIRCNLWRSCVYWASLNSTMIVDWYFSTPGWQTSENVPQVPVRAHVTGKRSDSYGHARPFEHVYDFDDFKVSLKPKELETAQGVYCPKRTQTKSLPTPTKAFHFTAEILDPDIELIGGIKEWYDYDQNIFRYDFTPFGSNKPFNADKFTQVHDFNTGVAYMIDNVRGNCTTMPINGISFDDEKVDAFHVRIRTAKEFYYFDKASYVYEGQRTVRGINCDVWIAKRTDYPPGHKGGDVTSIWEWYFAVPEYTANLPDQLSFGMPIRTTINAGRYGHKIYNIYDYDEQKPNIWEYDISKCYNYTQKQDFTFTLPGSFKQLVNSNMQKFKYALITAIQSAAGVSPLRISNIQTDYADNNDILVKFTLLDKAPAIGDVTAPKQEPSLTDAAKALTTAINSQLFTVTFKAPGAANGVSITAKATSLTQTQHVTKYSYYTQTQASSTSKGYSGGAMAGMGVGLLFVFFLIGVGAMYLFYRKMGGAFLPKKFENTDITQDTS